MIIEPIIILANIIQTQMSLNSNQVHIYNQNFNIQKKLESLVNPKSIIIILEFQNSQPYANTNIITPNNTGMQEEINMLMQETYAINILSENSDARIRKEEIIMSLNSTYSQQQQEMNSFKLATISNSFSNTSLAEGGSMLNRFTININLIAWYNKINQNIAYYNQFNNPGGNNLLLEE
jgi:hypothetical protein